jgi:tetrahydromethanopterin S-methyltransferase subunit G
MAEITKKDILEVLKEFSENTLDPKFTKIDQRFEQMDQRMDGLDKKVDQFKDEIIHRFHVNSEDIISQVKLVTEGVINLDEKFTREIAIFRKENEQAHEEIKAMIKFSYAELDRRISTLEIEVQELKRRMDQIERRSIS